MKLHYLLIVLICTSACKTQKPSGFSQLSFNTDPCFGTCPIFSMTINGNGEAQFNAEKFNDREGNFVEVIRPGQLDSLRRLITNANLQSLKNDYAVSWTDMPTYTLTVKLNNGQSKTIRDYGPSGPEKLKQLYHFLFSLRQSQDWK